MAWSNKSTRTRLTVEKSHSLSLSVRVEDRLHNDIIQTGDECWMTIRREPYSTTDATDTEATVKLDGVQVDTDQGKIFRLDIQASALNLDPEEEWFYDITYVTGGQPHQPRGGLDVHRRQRRVRDGGHHQGPAAAERHQLDADPDQG